MGEDDTKSIRLYGTTYQELKSLQEDDEALVDTLNRILPDEVEELEQIEEDVVALPTPSSVTERINDMAGDNVSANDVIDRLIEEHEDHD